MLELEQLWEDNHLTSLGQLLHRKVNQPEEAERRYDVVTLRSVPLASFALGLYGLSDCVELRRCREGESRGFTHPNYPGLWQATPIEYKRGRPKRHNADKVQVCAEAMCLEEMYGISIPYAYLYYGETRHRLEVELSVALRAETEAVAEAMHRALKAQSLPRALYNKGCKSCSLLELCMPQLATAGTVGEYYKKHKLFDL